MKFDFTITTTHILIIIGLIFLYSFFHQPATVTAPSTITNNYYDDSIHSPTVINFNPVISLPPQVPPNMTQEDTSHSINDYFTKKYDRREFSDANIDITVSDTLFMNSILFSRLNYKWKAPIRTEKINTVYADPVNKVFIGPFASVAAGKIQFGPELTLMNKKEQMISIGRDLSSNTWYGSYQLKISLRKKK